MTGILVGGRRFDLPLDGTAASRFLPWLITCFVCLAVSALGIAAAADNALHAYAERARLVTVTIPAADNPGATEQDVATVLALLDDTAGVTSAEPVAEEELQDLIEPWLGDAASTSDLPLPRLIDVTFDATTQLDLADLQSRLRTAVAGATLGIEAMSRNRAERLAAFFRAWSGAIGVLALLALFASIAWITRLSLDLHTDTVELLRFMGAPDGYVARQFERHALLNSVRGGLIGALIGAIILVLLLSTARGMEIAGANELRLRVVDWILLACVPVVAALLVIAVARVAALWGLGRMP
ncbi:MAG: hypothetical protein R3349_12145 [Geminicoccaceae bacterium]|nr:hypothetical protein [Geminicoccaceae bacterium]